MTVAAARALELVKDFDGPADNDADDGTHPMFQHNVITATEAGGGGGGGGAAAAPSTAAPGAAPEAAPEAERAAAAPMQEADDDKDAVAAADSAAPMAEEADEAGAAQDATPAAAAPEPEVPTGPTIAEQLPALLAQAKADGADTAAREAVWNLFHSYAELTRTFICPRVNCARPAPATLAGAPAAAAAADAADDAAAMDADVADDGAGGAAATAVSPAAAAADPVVQLETLRACYEGLMAGADHVEDLTNALINAAAFHQDNLQALQKSTGADWERHMIIALENPMLHDFDALETFLPKVCAALKGRKPATPTSPVDEYLKALDKTRYTQLTNTLHQGITLRLLEEKEEEDFVLNRDKPLGRMIDVLGQVHKANVGRAAAEQMPAEIFHNDAVNEHLAQSQHHQVRDYEVWKRDELRIRDRLPAHSFTVMDYDFLLTLPVKVKLLTLENLILRENHNRYVEVHASSSCLHGVCGGTSGSPRS